MSVLQGQQVQLRVEMTDEVRPTKVSDEVSDDISNNISNNDDNYSGAVGDEVW